MSTAAGLVQIQTPDLVAPLVHRFESKAGSHLLVVDGSRIYDTDPAHRDEAVEYFNNVELRFRVDQVPAPPPLRSLSLNLAQACNLGCHYCYAGGGAFGKAAALMHGDTARQAVDLLMAQAAPGGAPVVLGFMGGEPLLHRELLHQTARYASERSTAAGIEVRFSITTNGTLLNDDDARLFAEGWWTVQLSLDGEAEFHDRQRPAHNGTSAHAAVLRALERIEKAGRPRKLAARSTIAHGWSNLPGHLDHLISLGFDEAGFSPVMASEVSGQALDANDLQRFLREMIHCGEQALWHWRAREAYPFSNLVTALEQLHKGSHQPYPCGAGAGYLSVGADGDLFACHRFVNDNRFEMGSLAAGPDRDKRSAFLSQRHVHQQQPCQSCWARYLCGGGCHHEVLHAGRQGCDYVRGWLDFCLRAYVELESEGYFRECTV
jgi:uncharacterized protein